MAETREKFLFENQGEVRLTEIRFRRRVALPHQTNVRDR